MTRARVRQYLMEGDGCMQNSTAAPLPTAEPGIHSLEAGKSQHPCPLFRVPVMSGLGLVLDFFGSPSLSHEDPSKEEMSRSNLNPPSHLSASRLSLSIYLPGLSEREPIRLHPRFLLPIATAYTQPRVLWHCCRRPLWRTAL
jgi:hypothetical protein